MIDKNLFLHGLTIRKGDLYVKEILTQSVVVGWDLIPVAKGISRLSTSAHYYF